MITCIHLALTLPGIHAKNGSWVQLFAGKETYDTVSDPQYTDAYIAYAAKMRDLLHALPTPLLLIVNSGAHNDHQSDNLSIERLSSSIGWPFSEFLVELPGCGVVVARPLGMQKRYAGAFTRRRPPGSVHRRRRRRAR